MEIVNFAHRVHGKSNKSYINLTMATKKKRVKIVNYFLSALLLARGLANNSKQTEDQMLFFLLVVKIVSLFLK